ncbi:peptidylprolyl isomerase [Halothiobacillus sp. DCM-1]|uniref:FKBP-type peptidyl-prolyl cis-trans isomerase n=1 Tax=Halothiobacillus sp. DCM-1 TaxID=3112558 RepID=UPI0032434875
MTHPTVQRGDRLRMHYEIRLHDDQIVDSSFDGEPLNFTVGDGTLFARLEEALLGLPLGEHTQILLTPEFAFGERDPEQIHELPRAELPADWVLEPGMVVDFALPSGESVPGTINAINEETVLVDFNHPLAGRNLQFIVQILAINDQEAPT